MARGSNWFSLARSVADAFPSALPFVPSPSSLSSSSPLTLPSPPSRRRRSRSPVSPLRRRGFLVLLAVLLAILAVLVVDEWHSQRTQLARWAAELGAREAAGYPDANGRLDLHSWRERTASRPGWLGRLERRNVEDTWPVWWGNADDVGPSPFDHVPNPPNPGQRRRVLFLTDYNDYLERMNSHTYEIVDAALRHPQVIVDVWGPGWAGYDWDVPLSVNVKRRANRVAHFEGVRAEYDAPVERAGEEGGREWPSMFPRSLVSPPSDDGAEAGTVPAWDEYVDSCNDRVRYDIVWTISDIYKAHHMGHVDALDCGALLVQQLGDCHEHRCLKEWYPHANNITVTKYGFELPELFGLAGVRKVYPGFEMGLFGHSPDTGNEWDFYPLPWSERTAQAVIFGFDGSFYPVRTTVTDHLRRLEEDDSLPPSPISRHPHPGYEVDAAAEYRQTPLETYELGHASYARHRHIRADFARGMRTAQICVFDSSLERKLIRKYAQALLSGCVIAADLPTEHEEAMSSFVIPLEPAWGIERIEAEINSFLAQPERLQQMAMDGFAYARGHLTTTHKVSDMLRLADRHRAGARGYDPSRPVAARMPATHRLRELSQFSHADARPWCVGEGGHRGLEDRD